MTWWTWPGLRGAMLEQIPGELVDIGAGGCSLKMSTRLSSGTLGLVEIQGPEASIAEVARVCSITERPGAAAPFLVRLEFLPIALPVHAMAGDRASLPPDGLLAADAEKTGPSLTLVPRHSGTRDVDRTGPARGGTELHRSAEPDAPGEPLAGRLKH